MTQSTQYLVAEHLKLNGPKSSAYLCARFGRSGKQISGMATILRHMAINRHIKLVSEGPQVWEFAAYPPKEAKVKKPSTRYQVTTKRYQLWDWLMQNGTVDCEAVKTGLSVTYKIAKNRLDSLIEFGHAKRILPTERGAAIMYEAIEDAPPPEFGRHDIALEDRQKDDEESHRNCWPGALRGDLNILATGRLIRLDSHV